LAPFNDDDVSCDLCCSGKGDITSLVGGNGAGADGYPCHG
jgi:ABC-type enterochelin transport system ATPase subunit